MADQGPGRNYIQQSTQSANGRQTQRQYQLNPHPATNANSMVSSVPEFPPGLRVTSLPAPLSLDHRLLPSHQQYQMEVHNGNMLPAYPAPNGYGPTAPSANHLVGYEPQFLPAPCTPTRYAIPNRAVLVGQPPPMLLDRHHRQPQGRYIPPRSQPRGNMNGERVARREDDRIHQHVARRRSVRSARRSQLGSG